MSLYEPLNGIVSLSQGPHRLLTSGPIGPQLLYQAPAVYGDVLVFGGGPVGSEFAILPSSIGAARQTELEPQPSPT